MQTLGTYVQSQRPIIQSKLAASSWKSECSRLNIIESEIGHVRLNDIDETFVLQWVSKKHPDYKRGKKAKHTLVQWSPKTRNAYLGLLKKLLESAEHDRLIASSPLAQVELYKLSDAEALPFSRAELAKILSYKEACYEARLLVMLGATTGLRISELIALGWEDVDFKNQCLHVRRAKPLAKAPYKVTKTKSSQRKVELNTHAISALRELERYTRSHPQKRVDVIQRDNFTKKREGVKFVFYNSATGKPFIDPKQYAKTFFTPMLKALDIEHRGPNQIRHTFASQAITMGAPLEWVRTQLGHTTLEMLNKHYARWIIDDADDVSALFDEKMASAFKLTELSENSIVVDRKALEAENQQPQPKSSWVQRFFSPLLKWCRI